MYNLILLGLFAALCVTVYIIIDKQTTLWNRKLKIDLLEGKVKKIEAQRNIERHHKKIYLFERKLAVAMLDKKGTEVYNNNKDKWKTNQ